MKLVLSFKDLRPPPPPVVSRYLYFVYHIVAKYHINNPQCSCVRRFIGTVAYIVFSIQHYTQEQLHCVRSFLFSLLK